MPDHDDGRPSPVHNNFDPNREHSIIDLELDLDSPWPLDPMSPFLISSTEQPCSPLGTFSDRFDERLLPPTAAAVNGGIRLSDHSRLLTCKPPNSESKPTEEDEESRNHPSPFLGLENLDTYGGVIKDRMAQALRYFKESTEQHVLAQVWAPVKNGDRYFLTTSGQPFVLDPSSNGNLHGYRMVSLMYIFSVDGENEGELDLPSRVFKQKVPEWTPDVQHNYSSRVYSRLSHALHYNVHGTLALPVFEPTGKACVGVLELIFTSQKINYAADVDKVCKALEAVNLKSSEIIDHPNTQLSKVCNQGRHIALEEILEILTVACETYKLPLAQTWISCRHGSVLKKSCSSPMGQICMSTIDMACYLVDAQMWGFRDACFEQHLQKGQGVAGRAFLSRGSCFCGDITQFCKTQYPLVHYARMFKLTGCFAICLRSGFTGNDEYVLEFFLPLDKTDSYEQHALLGSLLATVMQHMKSLRIASGNIEIIDASCAETKPVTKSGKKRGRAEKQISLNVLQQRFSGSFKDAARSRLGASSSYDYEYDVFLSFRGDDTRESFTGTLFHVLCKVHKVKTFMDAIFKKGSKLEELLSMVEKSRISIVVFSKNFAESEWCLKELVKIFQERDRRGHEVVPVFYKVNPSELRRQDSGLTKVHMDKHYNEYAQDPDTVKNWSKAVKELGNLCGYTYRSGTGKQEVDLAEEIALDILNRLPGRKAGGQGSSSIYAQ